MTHAGVMSEAALQKAALDLARLHDWRIARFPATNVRDGKHLRLPYQTKGFPDTLLVRDRLILVEFKREGGKFSPEQLDWQQWLGAANVEYHAWFPQHWRDGTIESVLR